MQATLVVGDQKVQIFRYSVDVDYVIKLSNIFYNYHWIFIEYTEQRTKDYKSISVGSSELY